MRARGFSLLEMMIGMGILVVIVLFSSQGIINYLKQAQKVQARGDRDTAFRGFGQDFSVIVGDASISMHFMRLPVPVENCGDGQPCVRGLDAQQNWVKVSRSTVDNGSAVDFFQDVHSRLMVVPAFGEDRPTKMLSTFNLDLKKIEQKKGNLDLYVTWPLVDPTSQPFVVMAKTKIGGFFSFVQELASSSPDPSNTYLIFEGSSDSISIEGLNNKLLSIYNGYNTQQYLIQQITDIQNCRKNTKLCAAIVAKTNPTATLEFDKTPYFAIQLRALTPSDLQGFLPKVSGFGQWWAQDAANFMFPTSTASINHKGNSDFTSPLDVRRLAHYFHSAHLDGNMIGIPIELIAYSFVPGAKAGEHDLVEKRYPNAAGAKLTTKLRAVPKGQSLIFARKLGTHEMSAMIYQ